MGVDGIRRNKTPCCCCADVVCRGSMEGKCALDGFVRSMGLNLS